MEGAVTNAIEALGYWGVGFLMFLENVFPPIPSELIMPLAGFAAARGELSIFWTIVAGILGSVAGQYPLYWLGARLGEARLARLADRSGRWLTVSGRDVTRASEWFRRRGALAVCIGRVVPGIRSLISVPAGIRRMPLWQFTLYSLAGMSVWAAVLGMAGYLLGENYGRVESWLGPLGTILLIGGGLALAGWIGWRIWNCLRQPEEECSFAHRAEQE